MTVVQQCQDCRIAQVGFLLPDDPETKADAFSISLCLSARQQLEKQPKPSKPKAKEEKPKWNKDFWYGLVYCDSNGYASIVGDNLKGIWLGKTDEFIPFLKSRRIDGGDISEVLRAFRDFQSERKSYSSHLATKVGKGHISIPSEKSIVATFNDMPPKASEEIPSDSDSPSYHLATNNNTPCRVRHKRKSVRITFRKDPRFFASLSELISKGYGIPTIQRELKVKGYEVAYATLGRWVKEHRDTLFVGSR